MKIDEIRKLSDEELGEKLLDSKKEYMEMRFQHVSGQLADTSALSKIRKDIARIETVVKERSTKEMEGEK